MAKTKVDNGKFLDVAHRLGVRAEDQAKFTKFSANGRAVYVELTMEVGRVDLSGFSPEGKGFRRLGEGERFGRVECQIDFSEDEATVLSCFRLALETMLSLPRPERVRRTVSPRPVRPSAVEAGKEEPVVEMSKADRLALIAKIAKEKGVAVSPRAGL